MKTVTLDVPESVGQQLEKSAVREGLDVDQFLANLNEPTEEMLRPFKEAAARFIENHEPGLWPSGADSLARFMFDQCYGQGATIEQAESKLLDLLSEDV